MGPTSIGQKHSEMLFCGWVSAGQGLPWEGQGANSLESLRLHLSVFITNMCAYMVLCVVLHLQLNMLRCEHWGGCLVGAMSFITICRSLNSAACFYCKDRAVEHHWKILTFCRFNEAIDVHANAQPDVSKHWQTSQINLIMNLTRHGPHKAAEWVRSYLRSSYS